MKLYKACSAFYSHPKQESTHGIYSSFLQWSRDLPDWHFLPLAYITFENTMRYCQEPSYSAVLYTTHTMTKFQNEHKVLQYYNLQTLIQIEQEQASFSYIALNDWELWDNDTFLTSCACKNKILAQVQDYSSITRASRRERKVFLPERRSRKGRITLFIPACLPEWWKNNPARGQGFYSCTSNWSRESFL